MLTVSFQSERVDSRAEIWCDGAVERVQRLPPLRPAMAVTMIAVPAATSTELHG